MWCVFARKNDVNFFAHEKTSVTMFDVIVVVAVAVAAVIAVVAVVVAIVIVK